MRPLNGYRVSHRNRWELIQSGTLTYSAFMLFEYYLDIFDFDPRHKNFGTLIADFIAISIVFRCTDRAVRGWHDELLKNEFISRTGEKKRFAIRTPQRYLSPIKGMGNAADFAKSEMKDASNYGLSNAVTNLEHETAVMPKAGKKLNSISGMLKDSSEIMNDDSTFEAVFPSSNSSKALVSFKYTDLGNGLVRVTAKPKVKEISEYKQIIDGIDNTSLTAYDLRLIDETISDTAEISVQEKGVIDVFYEGDYYKYRNSLIEQRQNEIITACSTS